MRMKKLYALFIVLLVALMLTSCTTSVLVRDHVPSAVNMANKRNIGVASVVAKSNVSAFYPWFIRLAPNTAEIGKSLEIWSSYNDSLKDNLAKSAQKDMLAGLTDSGYFKVTGPGTTDNLITSGRYLGNSRELFKQAGLDAVVSTQVTIISFDEYIYSELDQKTVPGNPQKVDIGVNFILKRSVSLGFEFNIIDVETNSLLASKHLTRNVVTDDLIAYYQYAQGGKPAGFVQKQSFPPSIERTLEREISAMVDEMVDSLIPRWVSHYEDLMENTAKIKSLKPAYKAADQGNYYTAYQIFDAQWNRTRDLASGYNCAILLYSEGDLAGAIAKMEEVANVTHNSMAFAKLNALKKTQQQWELAANQEAGIVDPSATSSVIDNMYFFGN